MESILVFVRAYPRRTAIAFVCLVLAGLAEGIGLSSLLPLLGLATGQGAAPTSGAPGFQQQVVAFLLAIGLRPTAELMLGFIVVGMVLKAVLVLLADQQVGYIVAHMATDLRLSLIRALLRTRWEYYVHQPIGIFANAVASEAQLGSQAYRRAMTILALLVQVAVYILVALLVSWGAALLALVGGAFVIVSLSRLVRVSRRAGVRQTKLAKVLLSRLTDTLQAVKPLRAMAMEPLVSPLLEHDTERLNRAVKLEVLSEAALRALQEPLIMIFLVIGLYGALVLLAMPLATVIMLVFLCARILSTVGLLQKEYQRMVVRVSAYWSLRRVIDEAEAAVEAPSGGRTPHLAREIRLAGVSFAYQDEHWVLRDASLSVPAGEMIAITGPSGAGKTTVVDLVVGLLRPQQGQIAIDGVPLADIDTHAWRASIGYVPQETLILHESIATNVTLGDPQLDTSDVESALRAAGAWEFVSSLPEGTDTMVGERGLRFSGGQRQRIALARALVRKPALLILDEATAALDAATEAAICETLQNLRGHITILAICHQGRLIDIADRVYRLQDGKLAASPWRAAPRDDVTALSS